MKQGRGRERWRRKRKGSEKKEKGGGREGDLTPGYVGGGGVSSPGR